MNSSLNGNFLSVSFSREIPSPDAFPAKCTCNHVVCEQALRFGQAKRVSGERVLARFPLLAQTGELARRLVIMVIARLFTGQAYYCMLCYGRPSWMSFKLTQGEGEGDSLRGSGRNNWKEIFLASLPRLRQNFDARPLCAYIKPRWPHVPRR